MPLPVDFDLYLITDRTQTRGRPLLDVLEAAMRGGVRAVQLREKDLSSRELYELAHELRKSTRLHRCRLIINDRADIALAVDADGVHLGNSSMPIYRVRALLGQDRLIGVSCHNQLNVITAEEKGADFVTFGPIYPTPSKVIYGAPVGLEMLRTVSDISTLPIFGLGGVKKHSIADLLAHGAAGAACVSAILTADDPEAEAVRIFAELNKARTSLS